jgi:hypothetical protein
MDLHGHPQSRAGGSDMVLSEATIWRPPMTTGEMAKCINAILGSEVYSDRTIRAEIDAGHLRAVVNTRRVRRRSIRVTEGEFIRWAESVLHAEEATRLRQSLAHAS